MDPCHFKLLQVTSTVEEIIIGIGIGIVYFSSYISLCHVFRLLKKKHLLAIWGVHLRHGGNLEMDGQWGYPYDLGNLHVGKTGCHVYQP